MLSQAKTDWASLIVRSKFTVFASFYFVFEGNFPSTSPLGDLYLEGQFNRGFFVLRVWGAYIWRGLYMEGLIFGILRYYNCFHYNSLYAEKKMAIVPALLDSPTIQLCPKLCWHNLPNPSGGLASHSMGEGGGGEF